MPSAASINSINRVRPLHSTTQRLHIGCRVHVPSRRISQRFAQIEAVELESPEGEHNVHWKLGKNDCAAMSWNLKAWHRRRTLKRQPLPDDVWRGVVARLTFLDGLTQDELARLREWVVLFLHGKRFSAAGGLVLTNEMRVMIAAQACILILNLDLDYYDDWVEIIVYPGEFIPEREYMDEAGIAHRVHEPMSGESWPAGPVILSWEDVTGHHVAPGYSVVIHEFAHKLDMRNGEANGFPPLHGEMSQPAWSAALSAAYSDFCTQMETGVETGIDPYAAENPAEFFAVISEVFFGMPQIVRQTYPEVYRQLALFYRQDPLLRQNK